ncbi:MAG: hypothetical protein GX442_09815 [Candidatus Riflebacteria bacterium]|nr:hypothetical protein [Candidatus Riflebacteria bacterium]
MHRHLRSTLILATVLLGLQVAAVFLVWQERFESGAVLQVLPPSHLDLSEDVCNVETLRGLLESPDLWTEIRQRFDLERSPAWTARPLIERRFQEADPLQGTFRFRFRHHSPAIAYEVVGALLAGMESRWQAAVRARTRFLLQQDARVLDMNLGQFDRQLAAMPAEKTVLAVASTSAWAGILPTFLGASPHFEDVQAQRRNLGRRRSEISIMLDQPTGFPELVPRWRVVVPPVLPDRPVWPSRPDLLVISILNALLWAGGWFLFRCLTVPTPAGTTGIGEPSGGSAAAAR